MCKTVNSDHFCCDFPAVSTNTSAEKDWENSHSSTRPGQNDWKVFLTDVAALYRQWHHGWLHWQPLTNELSLALYLKQRTLVGLLNLRVHSVCRLLCCQLSCWLYLQALCTWEIWDVAQSSICAPVVEATGRLVLLAMVCMSHVNKNHQIRKHQDVFFILVPEVDKKKFAFLNWNELSSASLCAHL